MVQIVKVDHTTDSKIYENKYPVTVLYCVICSEVLYDLKSLLVYFRYRMMPNARSD